MDQSWHVITHNGAIAHLIDSADICDVYTQSRPGMACRQFDTRLDAQSFIRSAGITERLQGPQEGTMSITCATGRDLDPSTSGKPHNTARNISNHGVRGNGIGSWLPLPRPSAFKGLTYTNIFGPHMNEFLMLYGDSVAPLISVVGVFFAVFWFVVLIFALNE